MLTKDKQTALSLIKDKANGIINDSYLSIAQQTGFSKRTIIRWAKDIETKDMVSFLTHGNKGRQPFNIANDSEVQFICDFKKPYPSITIAQFRDIYHEDVIYNPAMKDTVEHLNLKPRSYTFFQSLFKRFKWKSPVKRRKKKSDKNRQLLREPSPRRGMLVQIDGTPFDWLNTKELRCLHLAVDDATSEILAGWFTNNECQRGYCQVMRQVLKKHGIPMALYSDKHTIFRNSKENDRPTQFGMMMEDLGIELIFANTSQAKGRVERMNFTIQNRLINDIIRFQINTYDELNKWFNSFYIPYINQKLAYVPYDPVSEYIEMDKDFDYSTIFCLRETRIINNNMFSYNNAYYSPIKEDGNIVPLRNHVEVDIRIDVFTGQIRMYRYDEFYECRRVKYRPSRKKNLIDNQKDLQKFLHKK